MRPALLNTVASALGAQDRQECGYNAPPGRTTIDSGGQHVFRTASDRARDGRDRNKSRKIPRISINLSDGDKDSVLIRSTRNFKEL